MNIKRFEDIVAWQKAKELTLSVYTLFKDNKDYGFRDQIQRASLSIMNNIAEGFERHTDKELRCSLYIAKGSCGEVGRCYTLHNHWGISVIVISNDCSRYPLTFRNCSRALLRYYRHRTFDIQLIT